MCFNEKTKYFSFSVAANPVKIRRPKKGRKRKTKVFTFLHGTNIVLKKKKWNYNQIFFYSTATVPMTLKCLDEIGIDRKVSRFVVPLGATINMDGIALYETIGAMFIIQLRGLDISLMKVIAIRLVHLYPKSKSHTRNRVFYSASNQKLPICFF